MKENFYDVPLLRPTGLLENRLSSLRKSHRLYIDEVATAIGCSRSYYQRLESGKYHIKDEYLSPLAQLYHVDIEELSDLLSLDEARRMLGVKENPERGERLVTILYTQVFGRKPMVY